MAHVMDDDALFHCVCAEPYPSQRESEEARHLRDEEQAAIASGRPYSGHRLKEPEYRREFPYEKKSDEWAAGGKGYRAYGEEQGHVFGLGGGEGRGRPEEAREYGRGERGVREEGVLGRTMHSVRDAIGGVAGGIAGIAKGRTINVESRTTYPICLRALVKPRQDLRDSELEGDVLFVQDSPTSATHVIGSVRGINPGLHGMVILENGDLTLLRKSAGLHFDAPGSHAYHGGANTSERHLGDLGNIVVKDDGVSFFSFAVDNLPLIDIAGRSLAIMSGEDDLGQSYCQCPEGTCGSTGTGPHKRCGSRCVGEQGNCYACMSMCTGNAGHALGLAPLVRTDLKAMERLKDVRLGLAHSRVTHREIIGRPMSERREVRRREEEREGGVSGGWQSFKESIGLGGRERRSPERGYEYGRKYEEPSRSGYSRGYEREPEWRGSRYEESGRGEPLEKSSRWESEKGGRWEPSGHSSIQQREDVSGQQRFREQPITQRGYY